MTNKVTTKRTWEELTRPLGEEAKKSGMKEDEVADLIYRFRREKKTI